MAKLFRAHGSSLAVEAGIFGALFWLWGQLQSPGWPILPGLIAVSVGAILAAGVRLAGSPADPFAWRRQLAAAAAMALAVLGFGLHAGTPIVARATLALPWLTLVFGWLWRRLLRPSPEGAGTTPWQEDLRLAGLVAAAIWVFHPYLTHRFIGGLDARWYLSTMADALEQFRAGVFPVFVGQGENMFNGAVHPFRSAPYHHYLGFLLDGLSLGVFTPAGLQHLTVLVAVLQGGFIFYRGLTWLEPGRPWRAFCLTLCYLTSPVMLAYLVGQEMYMTLMTFAYLPLLAYANVRLIRRDDSRGWAWLAASIALLWMCHPVTGMVALILSAGLQGIRLVGWDWHGAAWRRAAGGGAIFVGLAAYALWSMRETGASHLGQPGRFLAEVVSWLVAAVSLVRLMATRRLAWLAGVLVAAALIMQTQRVCAIWFVTTGLVAAVIALAGKRWSWWADQDRMVWRLAGAALVGGLLATAFFKEMDPRRLTVAEQYLSLLGYIHPRYFLPISPRAEQLGDLQAGYVVWALAALAVMAGLVARRRDAALLGLATLGMTLLVTPLPRVSRFLATVMPDQVYDTIGTNLWLRLTPTLATLGAFAGALVLMRWRRDRVSLQIILLLGAVGAVAWNTTELRKFMLRAGRATNTTAHTREIQRAENSQLYSYSYDLLPKPGYFTTGVVDYHLESRLLRPADLRPVPDPWFAGKPDRTVDLATRVNDADPRWVEVLEKFTVAPGERQAWTFVFRDLPYEGILILRGTRGFYRSYQLPVAGFSGKSFGSKPGNAKMLAVWNTDALPVEIEVVFLRNEPPAGEPLFGSFGQLMIKSYRPEDLQVRTVGLIPYVAEVSLAEPAFLETPRVAIPGYRVKVDGHAAIVEKSPEGLAMVRLEPGAHRVELTFAGSLGLWLALLASVGSWLGLLAAAWRRRQSQTVLPGF